MTHYYVIDIENTEDGIELNKKNFKDFDRDVAISYYNKLESNNKKLYFVDCNGLEYLLSSKVEFHAIM